MAKVPSQWTPQEAWAKCCETIHRACVAGGYGHIQSGVVNPPFPADPPEVVEVDELRRMLEVFTPKTTMHMAVSELLARREAERKA